MNGFALTFRPMPAEDSPLRAAEVPWDSEVFGFPFWELRRAAGSDDAFVAALRIFTTGCASAGECLIMMKVPAEEIDLARHLTGCGFYPVETQLEIAMPLTRLVSASVGRGTLLRRASVEDRARIVAIAGSAFRHDRFHVDSTLSLSLANRRYQNWVERAYTDGEQVFVFVEQRSGKVLGFYHIREILEGVDLSLAAIDPIYQGAGVGPLMYQAVLEECRQRGYRTAVTHIAVSNLPVANLFFRMGFSIRAVVTTFHLHPTANCHATQSPDIVAR